MEENMEIKLRIPPSLMFDLKILRDYYKRNKINGKPTTLADIAFAALQLYLQANQEDVKKAKEFFKKMLEE